MADWDSIEYGFNTMDETMNFGSRILAGLDNLYETTTLVLLKNSDNVCNGTPKINALIKNELVIFSINKTIRIFDNLSCNEILFNVTFGDIVDAICSDGVYLLACLRNGTVYVFDTKNNFNITCKRNVVEAGDIDEPFFVAAFIEESADFSCSLITRGGAVYRLTIIIDPMNSENQETCDTILDLKHSIHDVVLTRSSLYLCADNIYSYNLHKGTFTADDNTTLKRIFPIDQSKLLGLQSDGCLVILCTKTYQSYPVCTDSLFQEVLFISDATNPGILGITIADSENNIYLRLLNFLDMSIIFSIKLLQEICLITPEHMHDEILYISVLKTEEAVNELRIQAVTEANPKSRLERLIKRQKFDEAEHFAKLFNLNFSDLDKAKAQAISDKLVCETEDVLNLIEILNKIDDNEFKIERCIDAHSSCSKIQDVERILDYGCCCAQSDSELVNNCQYLYDNIYQLQFRFRTFMDLSEYGRDDINVQSWNSFSTSDLIAELCCALSYHRISEAKIIYNRLDIITIYELNETTVDRILQLLNNMPVEKGLSFLYTFIPLTLSYLPSSLRLFIKWFLEKVIHIEINEQKEFPDKAIEFLESVIQILKNDYSKGINLGVSHIKDDGALIELSHHLQALQILKKLKHKYRIYVPFQEYLQGLIVLAQILLSSQGVKILEDEIFFKEFIHTLENKFEANEVFSELVKNIIQYEEELWVKTIPLILNYTTSIEVKLESILLVLGAAKLPWSEAIHEIAKSAMQYTHPLVAKISKEIEYEPKCVILQKEPYNLNRELILTTHSYLKYAINRIIYINLPSMVDDIFQMCQHTEERHEANMALIIHFVKIGKYDMALQILDNNEREEIIKCCKLLTNIATTIINSGVKPEAGLIPIENCYTIIGSIYKRLIDDADCDFEKSCLQNELLHLQNVYKIQQIFNIYITTHQLEREEQQYEVLDQILIEICLQPTDVVNYFEMLKKATSCLQIPEHTVFLKFCQKYGDFNIVLIACKRIYKDDNDAKTLSCAASLLLKYMNVSSFEYTKGQMESPDINLLIKGLKLARKLVIKAILVSEYSDLTNSMELANWIQTTYCLTQSFRQNSLTDLKREYGIDFITIPTITAFNAFSDTLQLYVKLVGNHISNSTRYLQNFYTPSVSEISEAQLLNDLQLYFPTVKRLGYEGQALMAFKLTLAFQRGLMYHPNTNPEWFEILDHIIKYCVQQVQQKNFSLKYIDKELACTLLSYNSPQQVKLFIMDNLRICRRNLEKYEAIAEIYLWFSRLLGCGVKADFCSTIISMANWWKKIKNCPIPYDKFFSKNPIDLLEALLKHNLLNLQLLEEYCYDFEINIYDFYKVFLKYLLVNWNVDFKISECPKRAIIVKNCEDDLYDSCLPVIEAIGNKDDVLSITRQVKDTVSFYHYEVFMCISKIETLLEPSVTHDRYNTLLLFLKKYQRVSKPGQLESEEWFTCNPGSLTIDVLSEWRLPFTKTLFTTNIWNIIRPEVNLKTYIMWFDALPFLKTLTKDDICCYVIKDVISSGVLQSTTTSCSWIVKPKHTHLIQRINECLQHIGNLERATSAVYLLATNIPGGADQVDVIQLCYDYAKRYQNHCPGSKDVQKAVTKVYNKYYSTSVTHILYKYDLAEKQYLEMVSHPPDELIDALYMDERICKKAVLTSLYCPDINKAVDEIATLYNFDIVDKRHNMIKHWLLDDLDDVGNGDKNCDEENLIRSSYVCTSGDIVIWRSWLLDLANLDTTSTRSLNFKAKALRCLCNISDIGTIEKLTNNNYECFMKYIEKLTITSSLQSFGFGLTVETLDTSNKHDLLNHLALWVGTTVGTRTMAFICFTYNIIEIKHWKVIITAMLKLSMVKELKRCVYFLKSYSQFYTQTFYIEAWQRIIDKSFDFSPNLSDTEIMNLCVSNFNTIEWCPVLSSLKLESIAKKCVQNKRDEFVVLILHRLPEDVQAVYTVELLDKDKNILHKFKQLSSYGFLTYPRALQYFTQISDNKSSISNVPINLS